MSKRKTFPKKQLEHDMFLMNNPIPLFPVEQNKKTFTSHDVNHIKPLTRAQQRVFDLWSDGYNLVLEGAAGTGKSLVVSYLALLDIFNGEYEKIVFIRSAVPTRETGFLPGTLEEKLAVYEEPYVQLFNFLFKKTNQYKYMKEAGKVEFLSSSYLRGTTFDNSIIILDEAASMNYHELSTVITRVGNNSKIVIIGDTKQNDLIYKKTDTSGFPRLLEISKYIPSIRNITFTNDDIVRSGFVKEFLIADSQH